MIAQADAGEPRHTLAIGAGYSGLEEMAHMKQIKMRKVQAPEPGTGTVINPTFDGLLVRADGARFEFCCPGCGMPLIQTLERDQVQHVIIRCFGCKTVSTPPTGH